MTKKKVLVSGCNGKMGELVCYAVNATVDMEVLCGFDRISSLGDFPVFSSSKEIYDGLGNLLPDVIIDFSAPVATRSIAEFANDNNIPIVVATTVFAISSFISITVHKSYLPQLLWLSINN